MNLFFVLFFGRIYPGINDTCGPCIGTSLMTVFKVSAEEKMRKERNVNSFLCLIKPSFVTFTWIFTDTANTIIYFIFIWYNMSFTILYKWLFEYILQNLHSMFYKKTISLLYCLARVMCITCDVYHGQGTMWWTCLCVGYLVCLGAVSSPSRFCSDVSPLGLKWQFGLLKFSFKVSMKNLPCYMPSTLSHN